jgi:WD40 repeat protein
MTAIPSPREFTAMIILRQRFLTFLLAFLTAGPCSAFAAAPPLARIDRHGDPLPPDALVRLGTVRFRTVGGFDGPSHMLPDGKTRLVGWKNLILAADIETGQRKESWSLPPGDRVGGFSPDGRLALLYWEDGDGMRLYDFRHRKKAQTFPWKREQNVSQIDVRFSPAGRIVATTINVGGSLGTTHVWDVATGKQLWQEGKREQYPGSFSVLGFSESGKSLVLLRHRDNLVSVRDVKTGHEQSSFLTIPVNDLRQWLLAPDGKTVAFGTSGNSVRFWDVATGTELPALGGHTGQASGVAFRRDGRMIATADTDSLVLVRDWPSGKLRQRIELPRGRTVSTMSFSADGKRLGIVLWVDHMERFYNLATGRELPGISEAHATPIQDVVVSRDGRVVSIGREMLRVCEGSTGRQLRQFIHGPEATHTWIAVHPEGKLVASGGDNEGKVRIFDLSTGRLDSTIEVGNAIRKVQFVGRDRLLIGGDLSPVVGRVPRRFLSLRDVTTGREIRSLEPSAYGGSALSVDGELLAGVIESRLCVRNVAGGRFRRDFDVKRPSSLALAPTNRALVSMEGKKLIIWELATGKPRWQVEIDSRKFCFSPDGRWLGLAIRAEKEIELWDALRGRKVHTFSGHDRLVTALSFGPDGRTLVSGSWDTTLLVWDVTGVLAKQLACKRLGPMALTRAWEDLGSLDAGRGAQAIATLVETPGQSIRWMRDHLLPAKSPDSKRIERLLGQLDSDTFAEREQASRELGQLGPDVEEALRRYLEGKRSVEARRRAQRLVQELEGPLSGPELLRQVRALEALEQLGDKQAVALLHTLTTGGRDAWLTREAKASLRRLRERP